MAVDSEQERYVQPRWRSRRRTLNYTGRRRGGHEQYPAEVQTVPMSARAEPDVIRDARLVGAFRSLERTFYELVAMGVAAQIVLDNVLEGRTAQRGAYAEFTVTRDQEKALRFSVDRLADELRQAEEAYHAAFERAP